MLTDKELVAQMAIGHQKALETLYHRYKDKVYNTALGYLQSEVEAEEVLQDVFVMAYQGAARFQGQSTVSTWIYRICINKAIDRLRYLQRKKRFGNVLSMWSKEGDVLQLPDFVHPGILLEQKENAAILFKEIRQLPEKQQSAFILSFVEGLPQQEVANVMELSLKAVESLLQRAKRNLRKKLENQYPDRRK